MALLGRRLLRPQAVTRHVRAFCSAQRAFDVAVVGGGGMGSSVAFYLKRKAPDLNVCVVERDPTYKIASSPLSVGSIRQQFSIEENTRMSLYGAEFLKSLQYEWGDESIAPATHFDQGGYLCLARAGAEATMRASHEAQRGLGASVELLSPSDLTAKFPWISAEGVAVGSWGFANEGWFDPHSLMSWFKAHARAAGVEYISGDVCGVDIDSSGTRAEALRVAGPDGSNIRIPCGAVVNAAGAWAGSVSRLAGIDNVPIVPRRRHVFVFHCPDAAVCAAPGVPMVFDASGAWFRREGPPDKGTFVAGMATGPDPDLDGTAEELETVDHEFFEENMWEPIAARVPAFEGIKITGAWCGFYDFNKLDQNAIIGPHSRVGNFYFSAGFSGHGIQHCPAVGRAISELLVGGAYESIDLTRFGFDRIDKQEPFLETVCY